MVMDSCSFPILVKSSHLDFYRSPQEMSAQWMWWMSIVIQNYLLICVIQTRSKAAVASANIGMSAAVSVDARMASPEIILRQTQLALMFHRQFNE